ncbi:MAG TPA: hypothetical protein VFQ84_12605 [Arenimonas sp.]|uniref:hypothetical protein n=1 Tax=Arenimonas sp. TaxID=1872635 RepID=UPI002D7F87AF|nr:hypothetical protein [Arenimonas sp.]HEU0154173.1 hypothetical protein [Arenimonas sp.]
MVMRAALIACLLAPLPALASLTFEEGVAREPDSNRVLYLEQHLVRREGNEPTERLVIYRCGDGTPFARKRVDYRGSTVAPEFVFEDARLGYGEGLRRRTGVESVWVREGKGEAERSAPLDEDARLVADAGFDEFIRDHWGPLVAGQSVPLRFAVPSRLQSLGFKVNRQGSTEFGGEPAETFRLRLGGLLGWIAPSIDVAYGRDSRRLLRFEGLSNLRTDDGESQLVARIEFPTPARAASEAQWQAFAGQTLSACRVRG